MTRSGAGLRILVTVKQVPRAECTRLDADGRLIRHGLPRELNAYCRRALAQGVALARQTAGHCVVVSLGPPTAEQVLREALAYGADEAVLLCDPAFAGSDTLATARTLAGFVAREGPFDLILAGRSSLDAETGQVGPELAELLDLPFAAAVRELDLDPARECVRLRCEQDDGGRTVVVPLPALLAVAERLCPPAKVAPEVWAAVPADRVRRIGAGELPGPGPWGLAGSPTRVGQLRTPPTQRRATRFPGPVEDQVRRALAVLAERDALHGHRPEPPPLAVRAPGTRTGPLLAVLLEPDRGGIGRELLGVAAGLAARDGGRVSALSVQRLDPHRVWSWGADELVRLGGDGAVVEEDVARALVGWAVRRRPAVLLAPATYWGREVAARLAARLGAGLTADALELDVVGGRLLAWKPAGGSGQLAAIGSTSQIQLATVRPGVLPRPVPRSGGGPADLSLLPTPTRGRVRVETSWRDDDLEALALADTVVGLGAGVPVEAYPEVRRLATLLGAELAGTRKVTDRGWLPRSRQVGITGRSIAPTLYLALGISGRPNHLSGVRLAGTILAVNSDPDAAIFAGCDLGIVGDWQDAVRAMTCLLSDPEPRRSPPPAVAQR